VIHCRGTDCRSRLSTGAQSHPEGGDARERGVVDMMDSWRSYRDILISRLNAHRGSETSGRDEAPSALCP
jgi:hypothetical protein